MSSQRAFLILLLLAWSVPSVAQTAFNPTATHQTCFTPGDDCEGLIARTISAARRTILDKSQERGKSGVMDILMGAAIPIRIDSKVSIAHNKVIVIDGATTITGSFNFTNAEQKKNAENVLIVRDELSLAQAYEANFVKRWKVSKAFN